MRFPALYSVRAEEKTTDRFGGVDRRVGADDSCFSDMLNMTGENSPALSSRKPRSLIRFEGDNIYNIASPDLLDGKRIVKNAFLVYADNYIYTYFKDPDGKPAREYFMFTDGILEQGRKKLVISGTRLFFFPDGVYINLMDPSDWKKLGYEKTLALGVDGEVFRELTLTRCDLEGNADTGGNYGRLECKAYRVSAGGKGIYISSSPFHTNIQQYDTVEIKGFSNKSLDGNYNIQYIDPSRKFIVLPCAANDTSSIGEFSICRRLPEMDHVIACRNRMWGCRYGVDQSGKSVNEIYASALGDPTNWYKFEGVSTDSWTAGISSEGEFTGAACFGSYPVFFKEDAVIKVFGDHPGEFSVTETAALGIESGSADSAVYINNALYYKSYNGVVRYDGSQPRIIDTALASSKMRLRDAVGGALDNRYFVSMADSEGVRRLYVYDTIRKTWHIEDDPGVVQFCRCGSELYMLSDDGTVYGAGGSFADSVAGMAATEKRSEWMCESVALGYEDCTHKYVSKLIFRLHLDKDASCQIQLSYDGSGKWVTEKVLKHTGDGIVDVSLKPRRCSFFKYRLSGTGAIDLLGVKRRLEVCGTYQRKK